MHKSTMKISAGALVAVALSACGALGLGGRGDEPPPFAAATPSGPPTATPEPVSVSEATTQSQLEQFQYLWNQVSQGYAYDDYNGVDWNAIRGIYRTQVENGMTDEMFHTAMKAMVSELGDPTTFYLTPQEVEERRAALASAEDEPEPGYIGTLVGSPDGTRDMLTILYVSPGSPAEEAGVLSHDVITAIDGEPVPDEPGDDILERVRGEIGTEVVLTVQAPGGQPRELTVGRAALGQTGELEVEVVGNDIGYIFIPPSGNEETSLGVRVTNALRDLRREDSIQALIIDLRIARASAEWPVDELLGLFVHGDAYELYNASESGVVTITGVNVAGSQDLPLVLLVGYDTTGLSETFAGVLQALGRATIVGGQTAGNPEIVGNFPIGEDPENPDAVLAIDFLTARSLDGQPWGRVGVSPDVEVNLRWEEFSAEDDPQLEAAIEAAEALIG